MKEGRKEGRKRGGSTKYWKSDGKRKEKKRKKKTN